jgi:hypothetical protein
MSLWQAAIDLAAGRNRLAEELNAAAAEQLRMQTRSPVPSNFVRARCGQELSAAEILNSDRAIVVITAADDGQTVGPAVIQLPRAAEFADRELTIIDTLALGFDIVTQGDEPLEQSVRNVVRRAVRLIPLLSDGASDPDRWVAA